MKGSRPTPKCWGKITTSKFHATVICCLVFGIFYAQVARSQISQPARYELPHKGSDHEFIIISMGTNGLALVRDTEKFDGNKRKWEVIFLDTLLQETRHTKVLVDQRMGILGHEFSDGNIYLIFQESQNTGHPVAIFEFSQSDTLYKQHLFKPEVNIHFTHFTALNSKAIFGGYINREPALLLYDLQEERAKIIPGVFQPNVDLVDVRVNTNGTFNALLVEGRTSKNKKLVVRTFDSNGVILVDDVIEMEEGKNVLEAVTSSLVRDEMVIIGTWAYGVGKQAAGIFSVVVDPFHDQKINYYDLAMLNHFLDYLKPKRVAKIKAKAEWRKSVGKTPEFRAYVAGIRLTETKDGFGFLSEVYEPSYARTNAYPYGYNPYYYNPYGYAPYGAFSPMPYRYYTPYYTSPYNPSSAPTAEFEMINASVCIFDRHGKLVADHSIKFKDVRLNSKEQASDFLFHNDSLTMMYKGKKEIGIKVTANDGSTVKEESIAVDLKNQGEEVRSESQDNSGIRAWYDRYFYVFGYQVLKDNIKRNSHDVFYINKIKVD